MYWIGFCTLGRTASSCGNTDSTDMGDLTLGFLARAFGLPGAPRVQPNAWGRGDGASLFRIQSDRAAHFADLPGVTLLGTRPSPHPHRRPRRPYPPVPHHPDPDEPAEQDQAADRDEGQRVTATRLEAHGHAEVPD